MKLLIDGANIEDIRHIYEYYPVDGVTTNPTILKKNGRDPFETLTEIKNFLDKNKPYDLHIQLISSKAEDMVEEAKRIAQNFGKDTFIKIPAVEEGIKAINVLSSEGFNTTATAIYNAHQAFLAAKAGASYVAPYVNRMNKLYGENKGVETVLKIQQIFNNYSMQTKILGASFKTAEQVTDLAEIGVYASTVPIELIKSLLHDKDVDNAVEQFNNDFHELCNDNNATM